MVNEFGHGSKKFARHDVRNIGPVYTELDDYIRSPKFAALMSELTGIPGSCTTRNITAPERMITTTGRACTACRFQPAPVDRLSPAHQRHHLFE